MKSEILTEAAKRNIFLSPEALEMVLSNSQPMEFINTVFAALSKDCMFVDKKDIMDCIAGDKVIFKSPKSEKPKNKKVSDLTIINGTDVTGNSTCEGKINDFATYFKYRFETLKKIIERRRDFGLAMPINKAMSLGRDVKIIGMIYERKETKNNHIILTVEDETGTCSVFISKDSPLINEIFVTDEVIGISGKASQSRSLFIASEIYRPDIPTNNAWVPSDTDSSIAFLSDIHIGSYTFLEPQWKKMIEWLKANAYDNEVNYLVLPGDVVDGIGIFPGQEEELNILNIYDQYQTLSEYLKDIPDHMKIVMQPGNHDAVRLAEPQPALGKMFTKTFDSNIMMTSNPVSLKVEGRTVTTYHGKSIDDWIARVQQLTYEDPLAVMKQMLIRRHMAPMYGQKNALAPEKKDYLILETVPDIFVSGHVHGAGQMEYRGIKMINASTWQDQTEYQKMHNFNPDPGIMPMVQLGTGRVTMKNFMK